MNSILSTSFLHLKAPSSFNPPPLLHFTPLKPHHQTSISIKTVVVRASSSTDSSHPIFRNLKSIAKATILIGAAASISGKFPTLPARAETPAALVEGQEEEVEQLKSTPLSELLESNTEAIESLKSILQKNLEEGKDEEALNILKKIVAAQPSETEWKFLMARLLSEMGNKEDARKVFEEILAVNPLSFEALFENALLMDRCGEGEAVIRRLEEALDIAREENKVKEARDVRFIMAQIQFLQKNVDEALQSYQQLSKEDPSDFRPYFCRGMIYSLLNRDEEAKEQFAKYRKLSPKKFEVEGYLRTPLSRMKMFGSNEEN